MKTDRVFLKTNPCSPYGAKNPRRDPLHSPIVGKRVAIVGVGGAADCALDLLKSGVTDFTLYDPDTLEEGNLVRHLCGSEFIGMNKAEAVAETLRRYAGKNAVLAKAVPLSVFSAESKFENDLASFDLVIVGTDTDASRTYVNEAAFAARVDVVTVSMFDRGCGGEIFVQKPGSACFYCLLKYLEREEFASAYEKAGPKPDCSSTRDTKSMPGIGIDQRFLSLIASRAAIDSLLCDEIHELPAIGFNWIVFSVSAIPGILESPLSSYLVNLPQQPGCRICGNPNV